MAVFVGVWVRVEVGEWVADGVRVEAGLFVAVEVRYPTALCVGVGVRVEEGVIVAVLPAKAAAVAVRPQFDCVGEADPVGNKRISGSTVAVATGVNIS